MSEIWRLDDMTIKALKGSEPGKKVMRLNDGGALFLRFSPNRRLACRFFAERPQPQGRLDPSRPVRGIGHGRA